MTESKIFYLKLQEKTGRFLQIVQGIKNHESRYRLRVPNWRNDLHIGSVYYGEKRGCLHKETKKYLWENLPGNKKTLQVHNSLPF